jgi:copper(I)-binding protein
MLYEVEIKIKVEAKVEVEIKIKVEAKVEVEIYYNKTLTLTFSNLLRPFLLRDRRV